MNFILKRSWNGRTDTPRMNTTGNLYILQGEREVYKVFFQGKLIQNRNY